LAPPQRSKAACVSRQDSASVDTPATRFAEQLAAPYRLRPSQQRPGTPGLRKMRHRSAGLFNYPQLSAPIVHTLMTIGREHERDWASFGWGSESQSDHLPGVIFDGIGISKPVWRIPSAVADKTQTFEEWVASFEAWRDAHNLPDSRRRGSRCQSRGAPLNARNPHRDARC